MKKPQCCGMAVGLAICLLALALPAKAVSDGDWTLTGNAGTTPGTNFVGTTDNKALEIRVNNLRTIKLVPNANSPSVVAGFSGNTIGGGAYGVTIAGGGYAGFINSVLGVYGTVGGGAGNTASNSQATVAGGYKNTASGSRATVGGGLSNTAAGAYTTSGGGRLNAVNGDYATISGGGPDPSDGNGGLNTNNRTFDNYCVVAGGMNNKAGSDDADPCTNAWATVSGGYYNNADGWTAAIGGGWHNHASGTDSTIGGGQSNTASGSDATVPGGYYCTASGESSFATGYMAIAGADGVFAWADYTPSYFNVTTANQFAARAKGGVYFYTNAALSSGAYLAPGSGTWADVSDRDAKQNFSAVDGRQVLDKVASMPISTWRYKSEKETIRHMGPMAQDMHAAFGLGDSDKSITTIDADGVALAAIQGLNKKLEDQNQKQGAEIAALKGEIETLRAMIRRMAEK